VPRDVHGYLVVFSRTAKLFPPEVRKSGVLTIPVVLVVGALVYFLLRERLVPMIRRKDQESESPPVFRLMP